MHIPVLDQKIERPIDRDRGRAAPVLAEQLHHVIGAERLAGGLEDVERAAAAGGEPGAMMIMVRVIGQVCLA